MTELEERVAKALIAEISAPLGPEEEDAFFAERLARAALEAAGIDAILEALWPFADEQVEDMNNNHLYHIALSGSRLKRLAALYKELGGK